MARDWTMKEGARRIVKAVRDFARAQGWGPTDYKFFLRSNDRVGRFHVFLVARAFPGGDIDEKWLNVKALLNDRLKEDYGLADSINLSLRTFDEYEQGGIYTPGPSFAEVMNR